MRTKCLLILLLSSIGFSLQASQVTQTVRGTVIDKQTRTTLPGATVIIIDTDPVLGATTDENGNFRFENIPIGRVSLRVSFMGYHDAVLSNLNHQAGRELVVNVELDEMVIMGEEVVVVGNLERGSTVNRLTTVSARGFSVEEAERYAGSYNDIARMASSFAGVMGTDDSRNDIIIRGNSPTGLLWRLEGVDIPNPNHWGMTGTTGGPVSMLNSTQLDNSDFMTSAFPAEYGNAISGVFDLRMRNGNNQKYEFLGQIGFNGFEFGAEGPINRNRGSSFMINYRYSTMGVMDKMGMDFGAVGVPYYQDLSFKLHFPNTSIGHISVFGLGGLSDIEIWDSKVDTSEQKLNLYGGEGWDITNSSDMGVVGINQLYHINPTTYTRFTVAASGHEFSTHVDTLAPETLAKTMVYGNRFIDRRLFGSFVLNKRFSSQHSIRAGVMARIINGDMADSSLWVRYDEFRYNMQFDGTTWMMQPYVQWQYRATDDLTFNTGIHYQHLFLNNSNSLEPRLGLSWQLAPRHAVSLGYGLHSQMATPLVYFRSVYNEEDGTYSTPNTNLDLIRSHHYVVGYDMRVNNLTRIKAEVYLQNIFDAGVDADSLNPYSILNQGASFMFYTPNNLTSDGTGRNYGLELTLERFLNNGFYFLATGSIFESLYTGSDENEYSTAFNSNYVANALVGKEFVLNPNSETSRNAISIDIKTTYAGGPRYTPWELGYDEQRQEYMRVYDPSQAWTQKHNDYFKVDLNIGFKRNARGVTQQWGLEVTNLLDRENVHSESFNATTGEASITPQPGRMIIPFYRIIF